MILHRRSRSFSSPFLSIFVGFLNPCSPKIRAGGIAGSRGKPRSHLVSLFPFSPWPQASPPATGFVGNQSQRKTPVCLDIFPLIPAVQTSSPAVHCRPPSAIHYHLLRTPGHVAGPRPKAKSKETPNPLFSRSPSLISRG
ncbi:hypothetical protein COCNU_12G001600 [Cocos nucifera]|uniref:Uncharacterized protein n=1 Tax=Cocos nucifera TaxID=13894 RepID=A0A8K0IQJ2_COCNU|nr:hypothetical protein COCNU_12G001600 [Cocos nucifera]